MQSANMKQRSDQWLLARANKITASQIGKLMIGGKLVDDLLQDLVRDALGYPRGFQGNVATEYGTEHESEARMEYVMQTGYAVEETGFHLHHMIPWMGASPDGLVGEDGLVELKCPYKLRNADDVPDDLVDLGEGDMYWHQIQCQMHVMDRRWCDFAVWCPGGMKIRRYVIDRSWIIRAHTAGERIIEQVGEILKDADLAEDFADMTQDMTGDDEWQQIADQYTFLDERIKEMKSQQDQLKSALVDIAGKRKSIGHGVQVIPVTRQGSVDYKAMAKAAGVNPDDFRKSPSTSWTVRINKES